MSSSVDLHSRHKTNSRLKDLLARPWYAARFSLLAFRLPRSLLAYTEKSAHRMGGGVARTCPLCGYHGDFLAAGNPPRYDVRCPSCDSLERHRLLALRLLETGILQTHHSLLHFAPEPLISRQLRGIIPEYTTTDIRPDGVDMVLDIENLDVPDAAFDAILCVHVLEHVDDRRALGELYRVLRPSGVLYCMIPIVEGWEQTYENPQVGSPAERELHFGQSNHVRYFGRDFRDRVRAAGFTLEELTCSGEEAVAHSLARGERVFVCRKV